LQAWQKYLLEKIKKLSKQDIKIEEEYTRDPKPLVLVHRKKPRELWYLRAKPATVYRPTYKQILTRIRFGEIAKKAKGAKMKGDLPPAAEFVKKELSGIKYEGEAEEKPRKWELVLAALLKNGKIKIEI